MEDLDKLKQAREQTARTIKAWLEKRQAAAAPLPGDFRKEVAIRGVEGQRFDYGPVLLPHLQASKGKGRIDDAFLIAPEAPAILPRGRNKKWDPEQKSRGCYSMDIFKNHANRKL